VALVLIAAPLIGCSDRTADFCSELADNWAMDGLVAAIQRDDQPAITKELQRLQRLKDLAPDAIRSDTATLVDTTTDAVRGVTEATGPDGMKAPVDIGRLNRALGTTAEPMQRFRDYVQKTCNIRLG
jgi:hypothetical protein